MLQSAVIKIINNVDLLIEGLKENKIDNKLLPIILKVKSISNSLLSEDEKINCIKERVQSSDIFNLYYSIEDPIELLEDGLITQNNSIVPLKIRFDGISDEEKAKRIDYISTNFDKLINRGKTLTDILSIEPVLIEEPYDRYFHSSLDLPYCDKTLYLRAGEDTTIQFKLDEGSPWLIWEGSNHCYSILKQSRFRPASKWYIHNELNLIDQYINIFYSACLLYFKNVK